MTKKLLDNYSDKYKFIVTFANTGVEHNATLDFVHNCDVKFGFNTVWLEAKVNPENNVGTSFNVVSYETASRDGKPYEDVIRKYGIPNVSYPHCTRELKLKPMRSYLRSLGYYHKSIPTAVGIRADESRRVSKEQQINNIVYPLVDWFPTDKQDVLDWWEDQEFNLKLEEHNGNCVGCFKKATSRLVKVINDDPAALDWYADMEDKYGNLRASNSVFFRKQTPARTMIKILKDSDYRKSAVKLNMYENAGCAESCEVYTTE